MKKYIYLLIILAALLIPVLAFADGGMVIWPPDVYLDQSAQNAIVAWNGKEEIIILSNDIQGDAQATVLRMIPLPANPNDIKEGDFESFEILVEIMNKKLEEIRPEWGLGGKENAAPAAGVEITFHEQIGAHDVTVVKVNNIDEFLAWIKGFAQGKGLGVKEISEEFRQGVESYLKRDIKYFVFDVIGAGTEKESIKPLVYKFDSDYLFYPLLITGISEVGESKAEIDLFLIVKKDLEWPKMPYNYYNYYWFDSYGYPVDLSQSELEEISEDVAALFENGAQVSAASLYAAFNQIKRDLMVFPDWIWEKDLSFGTRGEAIEALQKTLINEGVWDSEAEATGYFGPITKSALAEFQEKYSLEVKTGRFDTETQAYFEKLSMGAEKAEQETQWSRNLVIGMKGDDVKALQEILILEGVWLRIDIGATGYFGPITKEAAIAFQEKHSQEILEPLGLKSGTGFVGSLTRSYLEKLSVTLESEEAYYGSSTLGPCETDADCLVSGCNAEICQSKSEDKMSSICIVPDKPLPTQLGYSCNCVDQKCQWAK